MFKRLKSQAKIADEADESKQMKKFVILGFILLGLVFLFNWQFIYSEPVMDKLFDLTGIPVWSNGYNGLHYTGIVSLMLLIVGLYCLSKRYSGKMLLVFFIILTVLPSDLFAGIYQSNFANGVYALEYDRDNSYCEYDTNDSGVLKGKCILPFKNHGNQSLTFNVSLNRKDDRRGLDGVENIDLENRQLTIGPREHKTVKINFSQPFHLKKHEHIGGTAYMIPLKINDKQYTRQL